MTQPPATNSSSSIATRQSLTIHVENLGKRFNREWIFRGLNYSFAPGNIYAITGANGSGNSTLLKVLWGQVPPSKGTLRYTYGGTEVHAETIFNHIAIATPYMDLIEEFTLEEQLQFHFKLKASRNNLTIAEMIDRMYLTTARNKYISNFSSGMRQRVKLALAFFTQADVVFLDEPGTNLDHQAFEWYLKELHALPEYCTIIVASNQPAEYPSTAQKIDIMMYK